MEDPDAGRPRDRAARGDRGGGPATSGPFAGDDRAIRVTADGGEGGTDIIEAGRATAPLSWRRSTVAWIVAAAVVVGAAAGYLAGIRRDSTTGTAPSAGPSLSVPQPLAGTGSRCAIQVGDRLQLGVEIVNHSAGTVTVDRVTPYLPLQGLRAVATAWGSCGQLSPLGTYPIPGGAFGAQPIPDGAARWLTITFDVLVPCPQALPVAFALQYEEAGHADNAQVWGFPDLGDVAYTGCQSSPSSPSG
ncbi:MAG TPA: hypothetical protein VGJ07_00555 [Rugosimonospora sp.]|jgi:hypothetical protein